MKERFDNPIRFRGFTLIEMLVVISILMLLLAVALPAFTGVVLAVHTGQSQTIINQLDSAVKLYQVDFANSPTSPGGSPDGLPPSNYVDATGTTWYGCQSIALCLTGYHQDANNNVAYGWHPNRNSPVYGPYNDSDKVKALPGGITVGTVSNKTLTTVTWKGVNYASVSIPFIDDGGAIADCGGHNTHPVFLDAFGSVILYYSTNNAAKAYATRSAGANGDSGWLADNYCDDGIHNFDLNSVNYNLNPNNQHGLYCFRSDYGNSGGQGHDPNARHDDPSMQTTYQGGVGTDRNSYNWQFSTPPASYYQNQATGAYYRSDFMLMSWGGSKQWYTGSPMVKDNASNLYGK